MTRRWRAGARLTRLYDCYTYKSDCHYLIYLYNEQLSALTAVIRSWVRTSPVTTVFQPQLTPRLPRSYRSLNEYWWKLGSNGHTTRSNSRVLQLRLVSGLRMKRRSAPPYRPTRLQWKDFSPIVLLQNQSILWVCLETESHSRKITVAYRTVIANMPVTLMINVTGM